ncbi:MAG: DNA ligase D [Desulfobulbaceae bacterium]|nr:DNA ligase D [Desulfobulbaceae bacterium]
MGLKDYREKRDFSRTREPRGQGDAGGAGKLYVIHKHAATRLHYDLRLEMGGVLKSWAVPKGPSLDPAEKRLAVQVEDHPLEYGTFEGTIPKGEYGGGAVMLWDQGTWEPEGDPEHDFPRGKLSFTLHGEKLRGSWGLAQMKDRDGSLTKNWLLIKHQDGEAVAESKYCLVEEQPFSVATRRSLEEIAAGAGSRPVLHPDPAQLTNARKAPQPAVIKPQLATLVDEPPVGEAWLHEIKLDGYRILARIEAGRITLLSRSGRDWTEKFPGVAAALGALPVSQAMLDGEVVVLRPDGTSDFQALQDLLQGGGRGKVVYYLFDLPYCNGFDLTRTPLAERKKLLRSLLARMSPPRENIRFSDHIESSGSEVYRQACGLAAEGIVSKQAAGIYEQKRSQRWLKTKCLQRQELVVGGWTEPAGSRTGFGALLLGYYDHGELVYAGRVGTGFTAATLRRLSQMVREIEQADPPFRHPPAGVEAQGAHWVRPELVAEVQFREWTRENVLRQASFKGLRLDKSPREIVREAPAGGLVTAKPPGQPAAPGRKDPAAESVIAGVRVSHPDKVLFPEQGVTKRALAQFYATIADFILPHVRHRPLTLLRCPQGRQGGCFYQKHLKESLPEALRAIPVMEKDGTTGEYLVIDDIQGLISLVQLGVLEIHPWGSSETDLEKPDILTFDLDPGPGLGWPEVIEGARLLRRRLEELGLQSFVKTSGGKGLHLVVPIQRRTGWREAKAFAGEVARDLARRRPDRFTAEMQKAKRQGRIFIDYLRNDRGATTVAAYSTRAGAGAPVSTPIRWEELSRAMTPDRFRIDNLPKRLAALKKDPWQGFFAIRQGLPAL